VAISFDKVTEGSVLLDIHRSKMGNTTMSEWGCWYVNVIEVQPCTATKRGRALVRWNGNSAEWWEQRRIERLYLRAPKAYREQCQRRGREPEEGRLGPKEKS
jgi:hypothetical protein